jgi:SAM-dependent methyltransferase
MDDATCTALIALNRVFYEDFAGDFADTRRGWLPGFDLILPHISRAANVLDVGCGNGRLLGYLVARGWRGAYTGLDQSASLLRIATESARVYPEVRAHFLQADLYDPGWLASLGSVQLDAIVCLAVLHHLPGVANRQRFVRACAKLLAGEGVFVLSTWQFLSSTRLRSHILPWETVGLSTDRVESGDYLLSWGQAAAGRRYCAAIDRDALDGLAAGAGLAPEAHYVADGRSGNLNLYGIYVSGPREGMTANPGVG